MLPTLGKNLTSRSISPSDQFFFLLISAPAMVIRLATPVRTALMISPFVFEFCVIINTFFSDRYCDVILDNNEIG